MNNKEMINEIKQDFKKHEEKHKQIEEMTKDLKENLRLCGGVKLLDHNVETIAYELSKKYQPKLPEDSVVITKENYDELLSRETRAFIEGEKQGSKETAEYFLKEYGYLLSQRAKDEITKQFNVEVKE